MLFVWNNWEHLEALRRLCFHLHLPMLTYSNSFAKCFFSAGLQLAVEMFLAPVEKCKTLLICLCGCGLRARSRAMDSCKLCLPSVCSLSWTPEEKGCRNQNMSARKTFGATDQFQMWRWHYRLILHLCKFLWKLETGSGFNRVLSAECQRQKANPCSCQEVPAGQHIPNSTAPLPQGERGAHGYLCPSVTSKDHYSFCSRASSAHRK